MRTLEDIIENFIEATNEGKISWEEVGQRYSTALKGYTVSVSAWTDEDTGTEGITASLLRDNRIIDRVIADQFAPLYSDLSRLVDVARRSAYDVDNAIGDLEGLLASMKPKR